MSKPTLRGKPKTIAVVCKRLSYLPVHQERLLNYRLMKPTSCHSLAICLFAWIFLFGGGQLSAQVPFPFPTDWKFETVEDESTNWWQSLRVNMVPGVSYTLQKSDGLETDGWENLHSQYGTDGEWICPLFEGKAPAAIPANPPPGLPTPETPTMRFIWLVLEKDQSGNLLISWNSLDDQTPKRARFTDIVLDPVWEEFDSSYLNHHGNHLFAISPQIYSPIYFGGDTPILGALDTAMTEAFKSSLPVITANIQNSVAMAANYTPTPSSPGDRAFFRIAADWSLDSDGDGRFDWQEIIFDGSNPFAADTDGDGFPDVAQDNSGPEPTLDDDSGSRLSTFATAASSSSTQLPPRAQIERNYISAHRLATYKPNWPGWEPSITLESGGPLPYPTESLWDKSTYSAFSAAVAALPLREDNWVGWLLPYNSIHLKNESQGPHQDPRDNGRYSDSFYVKRSAFRLRLDSPAPQGGYSIPLRIMYYVYTNIATGTHKDGPFSGIGFEDLILNVDEGETLGTPVMAATPDVGPNQEIESVPAEIVLSSSNIDNNPDYQYRDSDQGLCLLAGEAFEAYLYDYRPNTKNIKILWQKRRLRGGGTLGEWETMEPLMNLTESQSSEPPDDLDSRAFAYLRSDPGIFQFQAVYSFPDGTKIPIPYLRMADGKSIQNGDLVPKTNDKLKAGQPDYIGVCRNDLSLKLRNEAVRWLGSKAYNFEGKVSIQGGNPFNPNTKNRNKCNLFVTHLANRMGAVTPYFYRKLVLPTAPIAKDDWHLNPERNVDLDPPGWFFKGSVAEPAPGMSVASYGTSSSSGHVGLLDYDGSWISAGSKKVNKYIHLSDEGSRYKPTHFRSR
jgi:hypothetical protein